MQYDHYDNDYLENKVLTAPPLQLHLMVLDGAIRFARQARVSLADNQIEPAYEALNRARDFVSELISGLNAEHAPEMVDNLKQLFSFAYRNLALADLEKDVARIDDAVRILEVHRETWIELIEQLPAGVAADPGEQKTDWAV